MSAGVPCGPRCVRAFCHGRQLAECREDVDAFELTRHNEAVREHVELRAVGLEEGERVAVRLGDDLDPALDYGFRLVACGTRASHSSGDRVADSFRAVLR